MKNINTTAIRHKSGELAILDQQMLPDNEVWVPVTSPQVMVEIIKKLKVRGAPLIGVSASLALAHFAKKGLTLEEYFNVSQSLREARPTAVNLMNNLDTMNAAAKSSAMDIDKIVRTAEAIFDEDVQLCEDMSQAGATLIEPGDGVLTHCNTGSLATAGLGTALGVIKQAWRNTKNIHVYVDETRPLLQGGRLTAWELQQEGVPYDIICDNMAGWLMSKGEVQKIFVGSDRIALNGDFANKIGTYSLAVLAQYHKVPFYVVAPKTTLDRECKSGEGIPIEMRRPEEVKGVFGSFGNVRWSPEKATALNPAFDVAPAELATGFVIDGKVYSYQEVQAGAFKDL